MGAGRDMKHRCRFLMVPLNNQGIHDCNYGRVNSKDLVTYELSEDEFELLYRTVFPVINDRCALLIDDYESEEISAQNIMCCLDTIKQVEGVFKTACLKAVEQGTFVGLDF